MSTVIIGPFSISQEDFGVLSRHSSTHSCHIVCTYPIEDGFRVTTFVEDGHQLTTIGIELHRFLIRMGLTLSEDDLIQILS